MANNFGGNAGPGNARQKNSQAMSKAGQAGQAGQAGAGAANYEFGADFGATGAAGGTPNIGAGNARQKNQKYLGNATNNTGGSR